MFRAPLSRRPPPTIAIGCCWLGLICAATRLSAQDAETIDAAEQTFFETRIRPVLAARCYECHAASAAESGLRLDSRQHIRRGGQRGPAVTPGDLTNSLLIQAISETEGDLQMPPDGERLSANVIKDFRRWIERGAHDPRVTPDRSTTTIQKVSADDHWAYQSPRKPDVPSTENAWVRTDIDRFVLRKLTDHSLDPSPDASPRTLVRRLHFDLVGLPPTPDAVQAFLRSVEQSGIDSALAQEADHLLNQPQFGQRWGRHWLDIARYGESSGKEANISFPYAWRYRDYVIDALNHDVPYDRFLTEQLAGDLLPFADDHERTRLLIATGFLALGPKNLDAMDKRQFSADIVDEQIDATSRVFLASSIACARCHDHKFDPFSMHDYYALAGIFVSSKTHFGTAVSPANRNGGDPLPLPRLSTTPVLHRSIMPSRVEKLKAERAALEAEQREKRQDGSLTLRDALRIFWRTGAIEGQLEKVDERGHALPLAMGMTDREEVVDAMLLLRGDVSRPDESVPRGFPAALKVADTPSVPQDSSGRLELAAWLTRGDHPLTARVAVNRVWSRLMGSGIVASVDDFGGTGRKPSHPELLDHLAIEFVEDGWSTKRLIRRILLSRTWRQASHRDDATFQRDPENRLRWRMPKRRLEAEAIRDAMLSASGELDLTPPVGSLVGKQIGDKPISLVGLDKRLPSDLDGSVHRSVYLPILRDRLPDVLEVFDFAEPSLVTGKRDSTNVPTQALYLMNSDFVAQRSAALAKRLRRSSAGNDEFVTQAFRTCFAREPTEHERERCVRFLEAGSDADQMKTDASFCQTLFSTVEFRMLD